MERSSPSLVFFVPYSSARANWCCLSILCTDILRIAVYPLPAAVQIRNWTFAEFVNPWDGIFLSSLIPSLSYYISLCLFSTKIKFRESWKNLWDSEQVGGETDIWCNYNHSSWHKLKMVMMCRRTQTQSIIWRKLIGNLRSEAFKSVVMSFQWDVLANFKDNDLSTFFKSLLSSTSCTCSNMYIYGSY